MLSGAKKRPHPKPRHERPLSMFVKCSIPNHPPFPRIISSSSAGMPPSPTGRLACFCRHPSARRHSPARTGFCSTHPHTYRKWRVAGVCNRRVPRGWPISGGAPMRHLPPTQAGPRLTNPAPDPCFRATPRCRPKKPLAQPRDEVQFPEEINLERDSTHSSRRDFRTAAERTPTRQKPPAFHHLAIQSTRTGPPAATTTPTEST
jgi:hypothetical protein